VAIHRGPRAARPPFVSSVLPAGCLEEHGKQLTRCTTCAGELTDDQIARFERGPVSLVADHPRYAVEVPQADDTIAELVGDLRKGG
jgi:hypothetical protein